MHIRLAIIIFMDTRIIIACNEIIVYTYLDLKSVYGNENYCSEGLSEVKG